MRELRASNLANRGLFAKKRIERCAGEGGGLGVISRDLDGTKIRGGTASGGKKKKCSISQGEENRPRVFKERGRHPVVEDGDGTD